MKTALKIVIIAIVAIILIVVAVVAIKPLVGGVDKVMATTPFEKTVEQRVKDNIEGKDFVTAGMGFKQVMDYIDTEVSITRGDGSKNVSPQEETNARTMVFNAYAPMVISYANSIFSSAVWDESALNTIGTEAERMKSAAGADAAALAQLNDILNTIKDYRAAWAVTKKASKCSSVNEIASLTAQADNYKRAPLTNCTSLSNALNNVSSTAKNSVVNSIYNTAVSIFNKSQKCSYTFDSFQSVATKINAQIDSYGSKYGWPDKIQQARSYINEASLYVEGCYNYYNEYNYF